MLEIFLIVRYSIFCSPTGKGLAFQVLSQQEKLGCCCSSRFSILHLTTRWKHHNCVCKPDWKSRDGKQTSSKGPLKPLWCW